MNLGTIVRISERWPVEQQLSWLRKRHAILGLIHSGPDCPCRLCLVLALRIAALEDEIGFDRDSVIRHRLSSVPEMTDGERVRQRETFRLGDDIPDDDV
jgi:hypothetical protein